MTARLRARKGGYRYLDWDGQVLIISLCLTPSFCIRLCGNQGWYSYRSDRQGD